MATEVHSFYAAPAHAQVASRSPQLVDHFINKYSPMSPPSGVSGPSATAPSSPPQQQQNLPHQPNILKRAFDRAYLAYYRYEVTYGIYVMTPGEKFVANTFLLVFLSLLMWALFLYFPSLLFQKISRLVWLLTGKNGGEEEVAMALADRGTVAMSALNVPPIRT